MKLSEQTRKDLSAILGWEHEDKDYNDVDLVDIVEDLLCEITRLEEQIIDIEEDVAENYKYIGDEFNE